LSKRKKIKIKDLENFFMDDIFRKVKERRDSSKKDLSYKEEIKRRKKDGL